jgi:hypothetical protein
MLIVAKRDASRVCGVEQSQQFKARQQMVGMKSTFRFRRLRNSTVRSRDGMS